MPIDAQKRSVVVPPSSDQGHEHAHGQESSTGARSLLQELNRAVSENKFDVSQSDQVDIPLAAKPNQSWSFWSTNIRRSLKIAVAIVLVVVFGVNPLRNLLLATSVGAVMNGRVVTLRSPIDGNVIAAPSDFSRWSAVKGATVLHIHNPDAEPLRVNELRRQIARLDDERRAVQSRLDRAREALSRSDAQTSTFTKGRILQLESRIVALQSDVEGTTARSEEAQLSYDRADILASRGTVSPAELQRAQRDRLLAAAAQRAAIARVQETRFELDAVRQGSFLGDSYNDRPSSAQRADEIRQRIDDLSSDLAAHNAEHARALAELTQETERLNRLSDADVTLPVDGRIWEILVSPGERVRRDQDLLRVLDCSAAVVTANVEEGVYNQLQIGSQARFRPSDGGADLPGIVVNLTGITGVGGNFAILPQSLAKQVYHVTVSVPTDAATCGIGRTGSVFFDRGQSMPSSSAPLDYGLRR